MATNIIYNTVSLGFIRTIQIAQEAIYDPSDSDYLYTRINIKVSSILNRAITPPADNTGTQTPAQQIVALRGLLMTQCKQLTFSVGADVLFSSPLAGQQEDVKHGPQPLYCNIMRIDGGSTMHIEFAIETYVYDEGCTDTFRSYISNRWKETHQIDEHGMTKRTITGKAIFRGNFIDGKKLSKVQNTPDYYRKTLLPPDVSIPLGFKRISMEFTVPEDGLGLEYTIVDEEVYTNPPIGLTKFEAEYSAGTTKSANWSDKVTARGWANVLTPKAKILDILVSLCLQTFDAQSVVAGTNNSLWNANFMYKLHENYMEVTFTRAFSGEVNTFQGLNFAKLKNLAKLNYLDGQRNLNAPAIGLRGTANIGMIAFTAYLNQCVLPGSEYMAPHG